MSADFSIRPVGAPVATPVIQPSSAAANNAVATELPASQSVTATSAGVAVPSDSTATSNLVSRQAFIDQSSASMVYQVINEKTDAVIQQFPDEAVLRRRAYFHALDLSKSDPARPLATDRKA